MTSQVVKQIFPIVPAAAGASAILLTVAALLAALLVLFGYLIYSTRHVTFEISPGGLKINGDVYGRMIPSQSLLLEEASSLDLTRERDSRLVRRTNGTGLPGYSAGWFQLASGAKALAFVTDRTRVVRIPTRDGYVVLLSVHDPQAFLRALRQALQPS